MVPLPKNQQESHSHLLQDCRSRALTSFALGTVAFVTCTLREAANDFDSAVTPVRGRGCRPYRPRGNPSIDRHRTSTLRLLRTVSSGLGDHPGELASQIRRAWPPAVLHRSTFLRARPPISLWKSSLYPTYFISHACILCWNAFSIPSSMGSHAHNGPLDTLPLQNQVLLGRLPP